MRARRRSEGRPPRRRPAASMCTPSPPQSSPWMWSSLSLGSEPQPMRVPSALQWARVRGLSSSNSFGLGLPNSRLRALRSCAMVALPVSATKALTSCIASANAACIGTRKPLAVLPRLTASRGRTGS
eukprot:scaffold126970_cov63-Phaeocystis_antarctica.AAC.4